MTSLMFAPGNSSSSTEALMQTKRPWRQSLEIANVSHGSVPIPMGCRVGNMIFSSGILGADPGTGKIPDDPAAQTAFVFENMESLVRAAGATLEDVGRVSVYVTDNSVREHVNREWIARFPDAGSRPARHTTVKPLGANMVVQLEIIAIARK